MISIRRGGEGDIKITMIHLPPTITIRPTSVGGRGSRVGMKTRKMGKLVEEEFYKMRLLGSKIFSGTVTSHTIY